jgi:hypothetical protein
LHIIKFADNLVIQFKADGFDGHPKIVDFCHLFALHILFDEADEEGPAFLQSFLLFEGGKQHRVDRIMVEIVIDVYVF